MSMPFNMIYQAAYDREDEIRKDSSKASNTEKAKQTGRFATMLRSIMHQPERTRTYNATCATEQPAK